MKSSKSAALAFGYWSQNIGNAFFQVGGFALLSRLFGQNVFPIQDIPMHWTLHRKRTGNPERWWNVISKVEADYVFFQGPSLDVNVNQGLDATLSELAHRGVEPVLLSTGFLYYNDDEIAAAKKLIDKHKIRIVVTRDRPTYEALGDRASFCGIDSAFFVPWAFTPATLVGSLYIAMNFERMLEPWSRICLPNGERPTGLTNRALLQPTFDNLSKRSQAISYVFQHGRKRYNSRQAGPYDIVRLVHRSNPVDMRRFFFDANSVVADEPYTYLSVYANAQSVYTDRVHAAVAAIAYDVPVQMFSATPRRALLERVGLTFPTNEPQLVDQAKLDGFREEERSYLEQALK